jgi:hypothetical protein
MGLAVAIASVLLAAYAFLLAMKHLPPPRRTLDRANLGGFLHGLILFGLEGSYVRIEGPARVDRIEFAKRGPPGRRGGIEVKIGGTPLTDGRNEALAARLAAFGSRLTCQELPCDPSDGARYLLAGEGTGDHRVLESVAGAIVHCLGHPGEARYRVRFEGPKDRNAFERFYRSLFDRIR